MGGFCHDLECPCTLRADGNVSNRCSRILQLKTVLAERPWICLAGGSNRQACLDSGVVEGNWTRRGPNRSGCTHEFLELLHRCGERASPRRRRSKQTLRHQAGPAPPKLGAEQRAVNRHPSQLRSSRCPAWRSADHRSSDGAAGPRRRAERAGRSHPAIGGRVASGESRGSCELLRWWSSTVRLRSWPGPCRPRPRRRRRSRTPRRPRGPRRCSG
jgi:hypothetical protein